MAYVFKSMDELGAWLSETAPKVALKFLQKGSQATGEIWQREIAAAAPERSGYLSQHIEVESELTDSTMMTTRVGPSKDAFYSIFEEFGTKDQPGKHFVETSFERTKEEVMQANIDAAGADLGDFEK